MNHKLDAAVSVATKRIAARHVPKSPVVAIFADMLGQQYPPAERADHIARIADTAACLAYSISGGDYHRQPPADLAPFRRLYRYHLHSLSAAGDEFAKMQLEQNVRMEAMIRVRKAQEEMQADMETV